MAGVEAPWWNDGEHVWAWQCPMCPFLKKDRDKTIVSVAMNSHKMEHQPRPSSSAHNKDKNGFWDAVGDFFEDLIPDFSD